MSDIGEGRRQTPQPNVPEGFESGLGDWSVDGGVWAVATYCGAGAAYSGSKCAGTGLTAGYPNGANALLICAPFTVPAASDNPRLRFWHWFSTESGYDYGQVQIKVGSGAWQTLSLNYTGYSALDPHIVRSQWLCWTGCAGGVLLSQRQFQQRCWMGSG